MDVLNSKKDEPLNSLPLKVTTFRAKGKLLLTGEYFVLDGALALALPTQLGQSLQVLENQSGNITWTSCDADGSIWFEGTYDLKTIHSSYIAQTVSMKAPSERLRQIFHAIEQQKPGFFQQFGGLLIDTQLEFPRQWGLGTSSTLIANLAKWADIDPFRLLKDTFGGSGYDIACADATGPLVYQVKNGQPKFESIHFHPNFANQLYFIYLDQKQDSRQGIAHYREKVKNQPELIDRISELTNQFADCKTLPHFEALIRLHEIIIAETLELQRAKDLYFTDYWGEVKSLGAWGGDFVLATSERSVEETKFYFNEKGFTVVLPYETIIL